MRCGLGDAGCVMRGGFSGRAGGAEFSAVANVDRHGLAFADHGDGVGAGNLRHGGIRGIDEGLGGGGHGVGSGCVDEKGDCSPPSRRIRAALEIR